MDDLTPEISDMLADRFEGWELAELLSLSATEIIEAFSEEISLRLDDLLELIDYKDKNNDE